MVKVFSVRMFQLFTGEKSSRIETNWLGWQMHAWLTVSAQMKYRAAFLREAFRAGFHTIRQSSLG